MEPALPPFHPKLPELLERLGLRVVDAVKWNVVVCAPADQSEVEPTVVLKFGDSQRKAESIEYEAMILRDVLPAIDRSTFERLEFPELMDEGQHEDIRWMMMKYIDGIQLVHQWSEKSFKPEYLGGRGMDVSIAELAVDVLRDLRSVDIESLPKEVRRFDYGRWVGDYDLKSETLVSKGLMERKTVEEAAAHFNEHLMRRYQGSMFTNGDFYPRNFIILENGRMAVVDWVGGIDPWEFVAMYAWLLMWGNPEWQAAYVAQLKKHFPIDLEAMRVGMLVRSFELAYQWRDLPEENIGLARSQMLSYFHQCLNGGFVEKIFS